MTRHLFFPVLLAAALAAAAPLEARQARKAVTNTPGSRAGTATTTPAGASVARRAESVVRVNVTWQSYDFIRPWSKKQPGSRRGLGAVLAGRRVLVTALTVADASFVELEKPESGEKTPARVALVDYDANLALLEPAQPEFLDGFKPLPVRDAAVGDRVSLLQLENTGTQLETDALVTTIEVGAYPADEVAFLIYRLSSPMQYRDNSFTLPAVKDGSLAGLLMRYDSRSQTVDLVPAPVITHFLEAAKARPYAGFPRAGIRFFPLRDPQLRHYAGLNGGDTGGIYVAAVEPGSAAAQAGILPGDVLLAIDGKPVDQDGNYNDPLYGKLSISHLLSTRHYPGTNVVFNLLRNGVRTDVRVTLQHRGAEDFVVPPYVIDTAPRYYVLGGLVLTELSRQFLKEWGADWVKKAPERLVYYDRFQHELFKDGHRRIVILSQVLPSPLTIGYEQLSTLRVTRINGVELKSLDDVALAVEQPVNGFHRIEFDESPRVIFLDAAQVRQMAPQLQKAYGLPALQHL